jgi:hypothetical protein
MAGMDDADPQLASALEMLAWDQRDDGWMKSFRRSVPEFGTARYGRPRRADRQSLSGLSQRKQI